jgi:small ligand-binding sensory domain FIST
VIGELIGPELADGWQETPFFLTLGVNKGDKFGPFREVDYANRMCMAVDKERGGLIMFEDDLKTGHDIQLMRRSIDSEHVAVRSRELLARVQERRPVFALYIDCAVRASAYCGTEKEEAEEVQKLVGPLMPLLGMYSGVEIAKVGASMQALDYTAVLCLFSE